MLLVAVVCSVGAPVVIGLALDERAAAHGEGVTGTYTVTESSCSGRSCRFVASFRGDEGGPELEDVAVSDELRPDVGDVGQARYLPRTGALYALDSDEWRATLFLGVVMVVCVLSYLGWVLVLRGERRSSRAEVEAP
jgi:hypothetical protein